jgi:superfamily I DNA and/or RNA helicase
VYDQAVTARINVALTRSKYLLIVIGNANTLGTNEIWDMFLRHVVQQNQYMKLDSNDTYKAAVRRLAAGELTKKDK